MRVSKETAILLKDAGYDVPCAARYDLEGELQEYEALLNHNEYVSHGHSAPTLHEAADWLRSKGGHVWVDCLEGLWSCSGQRCPEGDLVFSFPFCYPTYESAYEAGIVHGLKYLP